MLVGQHPEGRRQVLDPLDRDADVLLVGLDLGLLGDLLGQRHDVELLQVELVHAALELRDRVEVVDDVDQAVDALLGPLEILAVDEFVLQPAVEQRRDVALDVEDRGLQLVRHVAQILLAEPLGLLQPRNLLVVGVGPGGELLADVLHALVLQLGEDLRRVHVARKDDRIDRLELVGHVLADDEERHERHDAERAQQHARHDKPVQLHAAQVKAEEDPGHDQRRQQGDPQRRTFLGFDPYHRPSISCIAASAGRCTSR